MRGNGFEVQGFLGGVVSYSLVTLGFGAHVFAQEAGILILVVDRIFHPWMLTVLDPGRDVSTAVQHGVVCCRVACRLLTVGAFCFWGLVSLL